MKKAPRNHAPLIVVVLMLALAAGATAGPLSGPGKVSVGVDASIWDSGVAPGPGICPITGAGQINGEFTTAERLGIQVALRAQERFVGPLPAAWASKKGKRGVYEAAVGTSDALGRATWNYDISVDLSGARGVAKGTTLEDYDLSLETDIFGLPLAFDLKPFVCDPAAVLYQTSQNPVFGNPGFDPFAAGTYNFRLVLTPATFNNPPLAVAIQVNVS